jgi:hypothetical protein
MRPFGESLQMYDIEGLKCQGDILFVGVIHTHIFFFSFQVELHPLDFLYKSIT